MYIQWSTITHIINNYSNISDRAAAAAVVLWRHSRRGIACTEIYWSYTSKLNLKVRLSKDFESTICMDKRKNIYLYT